MHYKGITYAISRRNFRGPISNRTGHTSRKCARGHYERTACFDEWWTKERHEGVANVAKGHFTGSDLRRTASRFPCCQGYEDLYEHSLSAMSRECSKRASMKIKSFPKSKKPKTDFMDFLDLIHRKASESIGIPERRMKQKELRFQ